MTIIPKKIFSSSSVKPMINNIVSFSIFRKGDPFLSHACLTNGKEFLFIHLLKRYQHQRIAAYWHFVREEVEFYLKESKINYFSINSSKNIILYNNIHNVSFTSNCIGIYAITEEDFFFIKCKINAS